MAHVIKTGNIVTPAKPLVTQRNSVTVKMGRDDAPLVAPQNVVASMATGTPIIGFQRKVMRQSLATELAKKGPAKEPEARILFGAEADVRDAAAQIFRDANGKIVRTTDMGDEPLIALATERLRTADVLIAAEQAERAAADALRSAAAEAEATAKAAKKAERESKKAERAERDAEILTFLQRQGYKGSLTADIRVLALDAMEQARQVSEYVSR